MAEKQTERTLTAAETRRKKEFERISAELAGQGYARQDLTVGVVKANLYALLVGLPPVALLIAAYAAVNRSFRFTLSPRGCILFFIALLLLTVAHEGLHGLTWAAFAKGHFAAIEFGVIWQMLTPYCTCREPMRRGPYLLGSAMPTLLLGLAPAVAAILLGQAVLFLMALVIILAGGADLYIILRLALFRAAGRELLCLDHPYECGLVLFLR